MATRLAKGLILSLFLIVGASAGAGAGTQTAAEDPLGAEAFVRDMADRGIAILNDTTLTQDERDFAFRELLRANFAMHYISRLTLGRHYRTASSQQKAEYRRIFPEYILRLYSSRLTEYGDEEFIVDGTAPAGKKDIYVRSKIVRRDGPPVSGDWRVRLMDGEFKIIDVKIEGISMVITQRDEFMSKISRSGLDALLADLRHDAGLEKKSNPTGNTQ